MIEPGQNIKFHGGWNSKGDRCPICKFSCGYIDAGVVIERYQVWDIKSQTSTASPDLWTVKLEAGGYVVGDENQFEIIP